MSLRRNINTFLRGYSYFHRQQRCLGYPEVLAIEVTNACMMDCEMCPRREMTRKIGHMDLNLFKKIIDQTMGYSEWIWLHLMGDPLLHPDIGSLVRYAKLKGIKTRLSTNPARLTKHMSEELIDAGLDLIHIALDGTNSDTYRSIRGRNADYEQAIRNIDDLIATKKAMNASNPKIRMAIIRMDKTAGQIEEFKAIWGAKAIDEIIVKDYLTWDGSLQRIVDFAGEGCLSSDYKNPIRKTCFLPWLSVEVLWDGRVVPCCFDYDGKNVLGDLNQESLAAIWNNPATHKLRGQHISYDYENNQLCAYCKEKRGAEASTWYPFNSYVINKVISKYSHRLGLSVDSS